MCVLVGLNSPNVDRTCVGLGPQARVQVRSPAAAATGGATISPHIQVSGDRVEHHSAANVTTCIDHGSADPSNVLRDGPNRVEGGFAISARRWYCRLRCVRGGWPIKTDDVLHFIHNGQRREVHANLRCAHALLNGQFG